MSYNEVTVVVEGAVDQTEVFTGTPADIQFQQFLVEIESAALEDKLPTEIYVQFHDHPMDVTECACAQYEQDGKPAYSWNVT